MNTGPHHFCITTFSIITTIISFLDNNIVFCRKYCNASIAGSLFTSGPPDPQTGTDSAPCWTSCWVFSNGAAFVFPGKSTVLTAKTKRTHIKIKTDPKPRVESSVLAQIQVVLVLLVCTDECNLFCSVLLLIY